MDAPELSRDLSFSFHPRHPRRLFPDGRAPQSGGAGSYLIFQDRGDGKSEFHSFPLATRESSDQQNLDETVPPIRSLPNERRQREGASYRLQQIPKREEDLEVECMCQSEGRTTHEGRHNAQRCGESLRDKDSLANAQEALAFAQTLAEMLLKQLAGSRETGRQTAEGKKRSRHKLTPDGEDGSAAAEKAEGNASHPSEVERGNAGTAWKEQEKRNEEDRLAEEHSAPGVKSLECRCSREWETAGKIGHLRICCSRFPYISVPQVDQLTIASLFRLQMFPYQLAGLHWMSLLCGSVNMALSGTLGGFILADEAGMGSSVQAAMLLSLAFQMRVFRRPALLVVSSSRNVLRSPQESSVEGPFPFASRHSSTSSASSLLALPPRMRRWMRICRKWAPSLRLRLLLRHALGASSLCRSASGEEVNQEARESPDVLSANCAHNADAKGSRANGGMRRGNDGLGDPGEGGGDEQDNGGANKEETGEEARPGSGAFGETALSGGEGGRKNSIGAPQVLVATYEELLQYPMLLENAVQTFGGIDFCIFDTRDMNYFSRDSSTSSGVPERDSSERQAAPGFFGQALAFQKKSEDPQSACERKRGEDFKTARDELRLLSCSRACVARDSSLCRQDSPLYAVAALVDRLCEGASCHSRCRCEGDRAKEKATKERERETKCGGTVANARDDACVKTPEPHREEQRTDEETVEVAREERNDAARSNRPQKLVITNTDPSACGASLRLLLTLLLPAFFPSTEEVDAAIAAHAVGRLPSRKRLRLSDVFSFARECAFPLVLRRRRSTCMLPLLPPVDGEVSLLAFASEAQRGVYARAHQSAARALCDAVLACDLREPEEPEVKSEVPFSPQEKKQTLRYAETRRHADDVEPEKAAEKQDKRAQVCARENVSKVAQDMVRHLLLVSIHPMLVPCGGFPSEDVGAEPEDEMHASEEDELRAQKEKLLRERVAVALSETLKLPARVSPLVSGFPLATTTPASAPNDACQACTAHSFSAAASACTACGGEPQGRSSFERILEIYCSPWELRRLGGALGVCEWKLTEQEACEGVKIRWLRTFLSSLYSSPSVSGRGSSFEALGLGGERHLGAADEEESAKTASETPAVAGDREIEERRSDISNCTQAPEGDRAPEKAGLATAGDHGERGPEVVAANERGTAGEEASRTTLKKVVILNPLACTYSPRVGSEAGRSSAGTRPGDARLESECQEGRGTETGEEVFLSSLRGNFSLASFLQATLGKMIFVIPNGSSRDQAAQILQDFLKEDPADVPALLVEDLAILFELRPHTLAHVTDLVWLAAPAAPLPFRETRQVKLASSGSRVSSSEAHRDGVQAPLRSDKQNQGDEDGEQDRKERPRVSPGEGRSAVETGAKLSRNGKESRGCEKREKGEIVPCVRRDGHTYEEEMIEDGCYIIREDMRQVENCFRCVGHDSKRLSVHYLCCEGSIDEVCFRSACAAKELLRLT
ncbi:SNF2 family amine-terminal domain protein [Toxoplasma gondii FOU]|uniref:SNF2 family amine-terminal domain protein n=1 Tax=Toxoplasma gondii FOU TaxID=943167 RepID=A0A086KZD1_TOXGO|nr:SNF2 family amine-terminal domain protein [Toxoplasma gondii FOU]